MSGRSAIAALAVLLCAAPAAAQQKASGTAIPSTSAYLEALRKNTTTAGKIALAEAAGPIAIARNATIVEMVTPSQSRTLREGTNGWTCIADPTGPICADATGMAFIGAMMSHLQPNLSKIGVAYMLAGDDGVSLTDPYATTKTADWVKGGPHTMLLLPDAAQLEGLPDNPSAGGPYVMWKGTPYAHVMVPSK